MQEKVGHLIQSHQQTNISRVDDLPASYEFDAHQHVRPLLNMVVVPENLSQRVRITPAFISKSLPQKYPGITRQMIASMIVTGLAKWKSHEPVFTMVNTATIMMRVTAGEYEAIAEIADLHFGGNVPLTVGWLASIGADIIQNAKATSGSTASDGPPPVMSAEEWRIVDPDYITVMEASRRLGVTPETVRRRCREKAYVVKNVTTQHGPMWLIRLDSLHNTIRRKEQDRSSQSKATVGMTSSRCLELLEVDVPRIRLAQKTSENEKFLRRMDEYYTTDRLKRMRLALGLTQSDASCAIGRARDYVIRMEDHGTRGSSIGHRLMIAAIYGEIARDRNIEMEWMDGACVRRLQHEDQSHD